MQLLDQHGRRWDYFIEVIKYSNHVYGSLDHFSQLKMEGKC